jgi:NAD(P)-dependent dehydrogenase (short-subunit alcohol dehydrogenase family)
VDVAGKVAVVTGGASGIGRALSIALADAGARGVVVADIDADGAEAVAAAIGPAAAGLRCDVSLEADVSRALETAAEAFGPVDLFCANAGVGDDGSEQAEDAVWDRAFAVNTRAHIVAARLLVPSWLERGEGYFLATASAAGLLTQIGSAPYAVSKHAAVAFAEWLSVTYGGRGIRVSCLCPMGVNTKMLAALLPDGGEPVPTAVVRATGAVLEPEQVADTVIEGLAAERFLILPHPEVRTFFERKALDYDRWLSGMRRLEASLGAEGHEK